MQATEKPAAIFRFGFYTVDVRAGELRKYGTRIPLQIQPFQVLSVFLERPNELITREELQRKLWPSDTFVDFDHGLNKAINKLRDALCDTAEDPRFIETVPRRGYRFVAPVVAEPANASAEPANGAGREAKAVTPASAPVATAPVLVVPVPERRGKRLVFFALAAAGALTLAVVLWNSRAIDSSSSRSLAVLPLQARGTTGDYDVADGLTDGLINELALLPGLRVISHASVFQYRNKSVDPRAAGRQLGVTAVLTGKVEQTGTRIVLTLELTAASDGRHLWGEQYTRNIGERAALQQDVAQAIGDALRLRLRTARRDRGQQQASGDAESQLLYFKGRYYFFKETPEDVLRARDLFRQTIDRDPAFALAYAALGDTYDWMATEGFKPFDEVIPQAAEAKQKANDLDNSRAEIHSSIAALEAVQWHWQKVEPEFQRSLAINPNYAEGHRLYSLYLRTMKRFPEALQHAKLFESLDPLSMQAKSHLALTYYYARQYEAAARQYRLILKEYPDAAGAHAGLASVLFRLGRENEAIDEWAQALTLAGDEPAASVLRGVYSRSGLHAARNVILAAEINSLRQVAAAGTYTSPLEFAYRYALLSDKENAFRWLEKAYAERTPSLFNLNVDPDYDALRDDARFGDLLARLHVPS